MAVVTGHMMTMMTAITTTTTALAGGCTAGFHRIIGTMAIMAAMAIRSNGFASATTTSQVALILPPASLVGRQSFAQTK